MGVIYEIKYTFSIKCVEKKKEWKLKNLIVWHALDLSAPRG